MSNTCNVRTLILGITSFVSWRRDGNARADNKNKLYLRSFLSESYSSRILIFGSISETLYMECAIIKLQRAFLFHYIEEKKKRRILHADGHRVQPTSKIRAAR